MTPRQIAIANAEASVTRWAIYTDAAREASDPERIAYGELRLANARKRLRRLLQA